MKKTRIVILGAGFGGLYTYLNLKKFCSVCNLEIVLVNKTNYFLFTPMLHEVATGGLNPEHVVESIREMLKRYPTDLYQGEVFAVDLESKVVKTSAGDIKYDYLVIALGARTNFYNAPGAEKYSFELKNLNDAVRLKNHIIDIFESASKINDPQKRKLLLNFVVVGGGATGVELAAEMAEFLFDTLNRFYRGPNLRNETSVSLLSSRPVLLDKFNPFLQQRALEILKKKGVQVRLNSRVVEVSKEGIKTSDGNFIPAKTVIWVAGIKANKIDFSNVVEQDEFGRIMVDQFLRLKNQTHIFALGDVASFEGIDGKPLPMFAQIAVKEAKVVAQNILNTIFDKPLAHFIYRKFGDLISVGQWMALGDIRGFKLSGRFTWWLWRTVYLFKFASWQKRIKIAVDWTVNLFYPRDISKLE